MTRVAGNAVGAVDPGVAREAGTPSTRDTSSSSSYTTNGHRGSDGTRSHDPALVKERDSMVDASVTETPTAILYVLTLYVTVPCTDGEPAYAPRELERAVLQHLRKLDGDCDCEVMTQEPVIEARS